MRRVCVVGNSGSGKSTLAMKLAGRLGLRHVELDAIFHQPGWGRLTDEEFARRVVASLAQPGWVADGNYSAVREQVWALADTVVWLDLPRSVALPRLIWRTASRAITRRELWNGNRESWRDALSTDPERSIIAWAVSHHGTYHDRYAELLAPGARPRHVAVVRLASPRQARAFLADPLGYPRS